MITTGQFMSMIDNAEEAALKQLEDELSWDAMAPKGNIRYAVYLFSKKIFEELEKQIWGTLES